MKDFKIRIRDSDKVLKRALAQTYAYSPDFANESDFKHELFHQMHALEINDYKLGDILPGYPTCMLHSEAKPINGLRGKGSYADLLICNPTVQSGYNYKAEIVIELKKSLSPGELRQEIEKFSNYFSSVRKLYIASANKPRIDKVSIKRTITARKPPGTSIEALDRSSIPYTSAPHSRRRTRAKTALSGRVAKCIKDTLKLYGKNREDIYHSFFWRNYEYHEGNWTFPCEGDFVCQLYHRLRTRLKNAAIVRTEYHPQSASNREVDLFVDGMDETVGIEVKMNYDNLFRGEEISNLSEKFDAMSDDNDNHTNFLVVIQGQDAYRGNHKADALSRLRQTGSDIRLFHYDENRNTAIGPVSAKEAQDLTIR